MINPQSGPQSIAVTYINPTTGQTEYVQGGSGAFIDQSIYGAPRQDTYIDINGIVAATLSQDIFVSTDISALDALAFEVYAISGTTQAIKAYPSFDGTNFSATPLALTDLSSGALATAIAGSTGATAIGNYLIADTMKARKIKLTYTASVAGGASIRGGMWKR